MRPLLPLALVLLVATAVGSPSVAARRKARAPEIVELAELVVGRALGARATSWARLTEICDDIGPRLTGSAALETAARWGRDLMAADGLDARLEPVPVKAWVRGEESLTLLTEHPRPLPMLGLGNSVGTPDGPIEAEVVVARSFDELSRERVEGRIVLFDAPWTTYGAGAAFRVGGASQAARHGAVATLVRSVGPTSLATPHTGMLRYADDAPQIPAAAVDHESASQLARMAEAGKRPRVRLAMGAHFGPDTISHNVVGELRGRERPSEIVVVACHLDSWDVGQGAQDDAAGCVAAIETGRILASLPVRPRRTVRIVLFTNEENGLAGGRQYAADHADLDHVAAIEMDLGAGAFQGYTLQARPGGTPEQDRAESERLLALLDPIRPVLAPLAPRITVGGSGADISPLVARGTLGFGLDTDTSGYWPIHHTQADTLDKIDPEHFQRDVAGLALMALVLAEWEDLPRVRRAERPPAP